MEGLQELSTLITTVGFNVVMLLWLMRENSKHRDIMMEITKEFSTTVSNNTLAIDRLRDELKLERSVGDDNNVSK